MTPVHAPACLTCGAQLSAASVAHEQQIREERFARAFFSRGTPLTYSILAFNIVIYLLLAAASAAPLRMLISGQDPLTLIAFGAKTNFHLGQLHQWFRLVTPIFIHIGLIHLVSNSYALLIAGPLVERLFGSARFLLIYLLAGIGGVAGSFIGHSWQRQSLFTPGAGASGALFGLFGVLFVVGFKYRSELPPAFRRAFGSGVLPVIAINLFIGLTVPFIDNAAHVGGLISGTILALGVPYLRPGQEHGSRLDTAILALCALTVALCFFRAYQSRPPMPPRRAPQRATGTFAKPVSIKPLEYQERV